MNRNLATVFISGCVLAVVLGDEAYRCPSHIDRSKMYTFRDKCYEFNDHERYWNEARDECKRAGGSLVEVHDAETMEFIKRSIQQRGWQNNGIWIGLTDHSGYTGGDGHQWKWIGSGTWITRSSYTNWAPGQPGTFGYAEDCAIMRKGDDWKWHDKPCHFSFYHYRFICQFNMLAATTTTRRTTTTTTLRSTTTSSTTSSTTPLPPSPTLSASSSSSDSSTLHISGTNSVITHSQSSTRSPSLKNANDKEIYAIDDGEPGDIIPQVIEGRVARTKQLENSEDLSQSNITALGLGIGIGLGVLIVCVVVLFVFICRRRKRKQSEEEPGVRLNNHSYGDADADIENEYHDSEENQYAEMGPPGACAQTSTNVYNNCTLISPSEKIVSGKNELIDKRTENPYEVPNSNRSHYEVPQSPSGTVEPPPAYYPAGSPPPYEEEPTRE